MGDNSSGKEVVVESVVVRCSGWRREREVWRWSGKGGGRASRFWEVGGAIVAVVFEGRGVSCQGNEWR